MDNFSKIVCKTAKIFVNRISLNFVKIDCSFVSTVALSCVKADLKKYKEVTVRIATIILSLILHDQRSYSYN